MWALGARLLRPAAAARDGALAQLRVSEVSALLPCWRVGAAPARAAAAAQPRALGVEALRRADDGGAVDLASGGAGEAGFGPGRPAYSAADSSSSPSTSPAASAAPGGVPPARLYAEGAHPISDSSLPREAWALMAPLRAAGAPPFCRSHFTQAPHLPDG